MSKLTLGLCSDYMNGHGIFSILTDNFDVPWKASIPNGQVLDDDYYCNRSANKIVSPYVEKLVDQNGLDDSKLIRIANVIFTKYGENWERMALALDEEYNPIHNYDGSEYSKDTKTTEYKGKETNSSTTKDLAAFDNLHGVVSEAKRYFKAQGDTEGLKTTNKERGVREDVKSFPNTEEQYRKTITEQSGGYSDTTSFNNRTKGTTYSGSKSNQRTLTDDTRTETTKSFGSEYTQERVNAFNSGLTVTRDSETLIGVGNDGSTGQGSGGQPSQANSSQVQVTRGGKDSGYTDTESFTDYGETTTDNGSETVTRTFGAGQTNSLKTEVQEIGEEYNTQKVAGLNASGQPDYSKDYESSSEQTGQEYNDHTETDYRRMNTESDRTFEDRIDEEVIEHELTKGGNLGVTTTQQMLTSEYDFRKLYSLFDTLIFPDVDKVLCLNIFGCEDLTLDDFTIINESSYTLPVASATTLGGIKIGNNLTINNDGTLSADIPQGVVTEAELQTILINYVDTTSLTNVLASYVTSQGLSETLASYITSSALSTILESYITSTALTTTLQDYVQNTDLTTALANYVLSTTYEAFKEPTYYNEIYNGQFYVIDKEVLVRRNSITNEIQSFRAAFILVPYDGYLQVALASSTFKGKVFTSSVLSSVSSFYSRYEIMKHYNIRISMYNAEAPARTVCLDLEPYHADMLFVKRGMLLKIALSYDSALESTYTKDDFFNAIDLRLLPFNSKMQIPESQSIITNSPLYLGSVSETNRWNTEARGFDPHCCIEGS